MSQLRVVIIGGGHLGKIHTRVIKGNSQVQLIGVADTCLDSRQAVEEQLDVPTFSDYRQVLDQVDAAIVATPTATHYSIANHLLDEGIHTFLEKPITNTTPQADHLIQLADRQHCILQVGHVERFNPAFEKAQTLQPNPRYIEAHRMSSYTMRSIDVGVVFDLMIHDIDLVVSLVNSPLVEASAVGMSVFGPHEDVAQARLEFANGTVANLTASRCSFEATRKISWFSESGFVSADLANGTLKHIRQSDWLTIDQNRDILQFNETQRKLIQEQLFQQVLPLETCTVDPHNAIEQEQVNFVEAIREERQPRVTGRHGRRAVSIAQSVVESINQHRWQDGNGTRVGAHGQRITLLPTKESPDQNRDAA